MAPRFTCKKPILLKLNRLLEVVLRREIVPCTVKLVKVSIEAIRLTETRNEQMSKLS